MKLMRKAGITVTKHLPRYLSVIKDDPFLLKSFLMILVKCKNKFSEMAMPKNVYVHSVTNTKGRLVL